MKTKWLAAALAVGALLSGCQPDQRAESTGEGYSVEQMNQKQFEDAIISFDTALNEADGVVDEFELDILKYRGEAEYRLGDYEAAVHTYEIL